MYTLVRLIESSKVGFFFWLLIEKILVERNFLMLVDFAFFWDLGFCCCCLLCHYVSVTKNLRSYYRLQFIHLLNFAFSGCLGLLILIWYFLGVVLECSFDLF